MKVEKKSKIIKNSIINNAMCAIIDSKNDITLNEIKKELELIGIFSSLSNISPTIKKINYSRKRLSLIPVKETHTPRLKKEDFMLCISII